MDPKNRQEPDPSPEPEDAEDASEERGGAEAEETSHDPRLLAREIVHPLPFDYEEGFPEASDPPPPPSDAPRS